MPADDGARRAAPSSSSRPGRYGHPGALQRRHRGHEPYGGDREAAARRERRSPTAPFGNLGDRLPRSRQRTTPARASPSTRTTARSRLAEGLDAHPHAQSAPFTFEVLDGAGGPRMFAVMTGIPGCRAGAPTSVRSRAAIIETCAYVNQTGLPIPEGQDTATEPREMYWRRPIHSSDQPTCYVQRPRPRRGDRVPRDRNAGATPRSPRGACCEDRRVGRRRRVVRLRRSRAA